ncbi:hypothetical protein J3492_04445 [Psychrobacter sp. F1192]|uniref:Phosphoesterase n=1 Tax=Psychrobacter coccoides TaxID=2818440 RepID=A0ABS3NM84_9GAMM|nr:hypothetical protein [Psychrobacter coccoides]MBO1530463.1 hypothetical protein [Psychrobacter coccoides]
MTNHAIYTLCIIMATALLAYVVLWSCLQTFNANPSTRFMRIWPKLGLYYAAYTMPFWALLLLVGWTQDLTPLLSGLSVSVVLMALIAMGLYFYAVIVQPNRLRLHHQTIDISLQSPLSIAVLADLRIGLYSGKPRHIRKLVTTINELSVDAVLITGDWLYYPGADLVGQLMLFKGVNKPVYTVMSTSDLRYQSLNTTKQGQPLLEDTLAAAFDVLDITYIGQQYRLLPQSAQRHKNNTLRPQVQSNDSPSHVAMLCGWQDLPQPSAQGAHLSAKNAVHSAKQMTTHANGVTSECMTNQQQANQANHAKRGVSIVADKAALCTEIGNATLPVIILASRFDSITDLPSTLQPRPLLITGAAKPVSPSHLPRQAEGAANDKARAAVTLMSKTAFDNKCGVYQHSNAQVFISSGIGTRGLPFRIRRPTIDVLTIR